MLMHHHPKYLTIVGLCNYLGLNTRMMWYQMYYLMENRRNVSLVHLSTLNLMMDQNYNQFHFSYCIMSTMTPHVKP